MIDDTSSLTRIVTAELARPAPPSALALATEIRRRHGNAVAAILFYGSCLRTQNTDEGVLDFYVIVDTYRAAYNSRVLAGLNAVLPPNVFYLEVPREEKIVRTKYAVLSTADFVYAVSPRSIHTGIWARFCQPVALVYVRNESIHDVVVCATVRAILTMATRVSVLLPADNGVQRFAPQALWQHGFSETYRAELRPESNATIRKLYCADPYRYDRVAREALGILERQGFLRVVSRTTTQVEITMPAQRRWRGRLAWRLRRPLTKMLYLLRLVKSAATFTDWLPYVLWKHERHTGVRIEPSARQRKYPLLCGWPLIVKLLLRRDFR